MSNIATSEEQDVGINALGQASRQAHCGCVPHRVEREDDIKERRSQHGRENLTCETYENWLLALWFGEMGWTSGSRGAGCPKSQQ